MKTALYTMLLLLLPLAGISQKGLATVEQDPEITRLLEIYKKMNSKTEYFTIQIGFGSYTEATNLKADASVDFPEYGARIIFDSPTYRVHLGRFSNRLDVERTFAEVRKKYPQSIILRPQTGN
ncbi:SPOR domain-containing protein [Muriicola jejuensis]|uniref:SPOR domain-containing protein n=1 Tax=Muriicola jejuensis TaxID=504488 RepID=A0A6P0UAC2_9FLAO|nr:SPOR domain-containing protein [Muriicola jejuensis]NER09522.1 SPOR domain-containing protein [Muriicola jejuensis]